MVLFKRKPVQFLSQPNELGDQHEIWIMRSTGELFTDYESYLKRYDYLNQKKFTDAINGKSGLTFFDAQQSENKSSSAIENVFPDAVKDPILRRVQFETISRIDDLVNVTYDLFKRDFFPGEEVIAMLPDGEQHLATIREKALFPEIKGPDGSVHRPAFARYFVRLNDTEGGEEVLLDDSNIRRDKKVFTKQNLRAFLKNSLTREGWIGAPWLVKEHLAIHYRLPMEIPFHLLQESKISASKQTTLQTKPQKQSRKTKLSGDFLHSANGLPSQQVPAHAKPKPEPPPPIKYPIEDLDIAPKQNGVTRPELKFFTPEMAEYIQTNRRSAVSGMSMASLGTFLECWNTLNVQCEIYVIDSFTFDDFVEAMKWDTTTPECELLNEVHCAVLKTLVDKEGAHHIQIKLPKIVEDSDDDDDDEDDDNEDDSADISIQNDVPAQSTRSKSARTSFVVPEPEVRVHNAAGFIGDKSWQARIKDHDFEEGGWQVILIGILYQMSFGYQFEQQCEDILRVLAPVDGETTAAAALENYLGMDVNRRIAALQIITHLSLASKPVREFLESCAADMTATRRRKQEHQRARRIAMEQLVIKERERRALLPTSAPASPKTEDNTDLEVREDTIMTNGGHGSDVDEDVAPSSRSLRRGQERKRKRDEELARREKQKAEKADKAVLQQNKELRKANQEIDALEKEIERNEEAIVECDRDLREANVQRTRLLGQDRFFNRYWWFERNGQPFGGLPSSSTAGNGYANGRIWVQGPDAYEIGPYMDDDDFQKEYRTKFRMTLTERRRQEEGSTILLDPMEWGVIDDADRLDNLIGWLDERGNREKKLLKELSEWRETIVQYMAAMHKYRDDEAARRIEEEQQPRITTRHQTAVDLPAARHPVLRWTNSMAIDEIGHIHSTEPRRTIKVRQKQNKGVATLVNRQGKPLARQGTK